MQAQGDLPQPGALTAEAKLLRDGGNLEPLASQEAPLFPEANWMKASAATADDKVSRGGAGP